MVLNTVYYNLSTKYYNFGIVTSSSKFLRFKIENGCANLKLELIEYYFKLSGTKQCFLCTCSSESIVL